MMLSFSVSTPITQLTASFTKRNPVIDLVLNYLGFLLVCGAFTRVDWVSGLAVETVCGVLAFFSVRGMNFLGATKANRCFFAAFFFWMPVDAAVVPQRGWIILLAVQSTRIPEELYH